MPTQAPTIHSLPALAAAIRTTGRRPFRTVPDALLRGPMIVPMYRVSNHAHAREVNDAVQALDGIIDRLRRLAAAYGEWSTFDAGAYFDLTDAQSAALLHVVERVNTVHVTFHADLLLPTFRRAAGYWASHFVNAHAAAYAPAIGADVYAAYDDDFVLDAQPEMIRLWTRIHAIVQEVRETLADDPGFLATLSTREEQAHWDAYWQLACVPGIAGDLLPELSQIPTLTLMFEFPLPAYRQSGRLRRLRQNRERRRRRQR